MIPLLLLQTWFADFSLDLKRIQAHLKVGDEALAVSESHRLLEIHPDQVQSYIMCIAALAQAGESTHMLEVWGKFAARFPQEAYGQQVLESMCWGILRQGSQASALSTRLLSIIGATLTQDAYAIDFLLKGLRDSNAVIRALSVELASLLGDRPLKDEILSLLQKETKAEVRLEVLKAIGKLQLTEAHEILLQIMEDRHASAEERALAIRATLEITQQTDSKQLYRLAADPRAALRQLAAEMVAKFEMRDQIPLLLQLTHDPQPEVAASALHTLGLLRIHRFQNRNLVEEFKTLTTTADPLIGVTASWVVLLHDVPAGMQAFERWIMHEKEDVRAMAAAAISSAGPYGVDAALKFVRQTQDPYVQLNLTRVLIGQRVCSEEACALLDRLLREHQERWMEGEQAFSPLLRSRLAHRPGMPNYPEVVNQTVRLELLNTLAILEHPKAGEALRAFLKTRPYGVTGLAAEVLLREGDEMAIEQVRYLLEDPDKQVRAEAALVLATWGRDTSALPVLLDVYSEADRNLKIKILEALGRISNKETIPFLIERLKEPSMNVRVIAAAVLLQSLNR